MGNFYFSNGIFFIVNKKPDVLALNEYKKVNRSPSFAVQSGPWLLLNSTINPKLSSSIKTKFTRSAIGVSKSQKVFIAISKTPITQYSFAQYLTKDYGCKSALYLDGGVVSHVSDDFSFNVNQKLFSTILVNQATDQSHYNDAL